MASFIRRATRRIFGSIIQALKLIPQIYLLKKEAGKTPRFDFRLANAKLCLADATATTGFDRHYIFHTAWAARILAKSRPVEHVDISSSLYFIGTVSAFVPIRFLDYRPANLGLHGLKEQAADIRNLPFRANSVPSLSCMHVVEHIGLGRYGDPLDYNGDLAACNELKRVLAPGGQLLFVVPIAANPHIAFNAHRVYSRSQIEQMFNGLVLEEFSLIPDRAEDGGLVSLPSEELLARQRYGCGCFLFKKPTAPDSFGGDN